MGCGLGPSDWALGAPEADDGDPAEMAIPDQFSRLSMAGAEGPSGGPILQCAISDARDYWDRKSCYGQAQ